MGIVSDKKRESNSVSNVASSSTQPRPAETSDNNSADFQHECAHSFYGSDSDEDSDSTSSSSSEEDLEEEEDEEDDFLENGEDEEEQDEAQRAASDENASSDLLESKSVGKSAQNKDTSAKLTQTKDSPKTDEKTGC